MYYILVDDLITRTKLISYLKDKGINAVFHYVPLHTSPAGRKHGRNHGDMTLTDSLSDRIIRLPLWIGLTDVSIVVATILEFFQL